MSVATVLKRFTAPPPLNVGGGDLLTRMLATLGLLVLVVMTAPQAKVPYPVLKISLLIVAELGLVSMMLGLFLRSKTYFAGLQLFFGSLGILWLASRQMPWVGIAVGLLLVVVGVSEIVARRSRLNALFELSSWHVPLEEVAAAGAALEALPNGGTK